PEYLEGPTKEPVTVPAVLNGRVARPGDVNDWPVQLKKGEPIDFDLRAAGLGSPLRGVLTLLDAAGKEFARAESAPRAQPDPSLHFTAPADGTYHVRVAERFRHRGGPDFAYRLRVAPRGQPDFRLHFTTDAISLRQKGEFKWQIDAERLGGFNDPITLAVDG